MRTRVLTALGLVPVVLGALFSTSPIPAFLLGLAFLIPGVEELSRLVRRRSVWLGIAPVLAFCAAPLLYLRERPVPPDHFVLYGAFASLLGVGAAAALARAFQAGEPVGAPPKAGPLLGMLVSGWLLGPFTCIYVLHAFGRAHAGPTTPWIFATPVLLTMIPIWAGDTMAIVAGKLFGRHPMAPMISPKKTWEGAIANLAACVAASVPLAVWVGYTPWIGAACGLAAGVFGQLGDLFESWVKRQAGLKDSGWLLPGHGGIMDRIDSMLFAAPAIAAVLVWLT